MPGHGYVPLSCTVCGGRGWTDTGVCEGCTECSECGEVCEGELCDECDEQELEE